MKNKPPMTVEEVLDIVAFVVKSYKDNPDMYVDDMDMKELMESCQVSEMAFCTIAAFAVRTAATEIGDHIATELRDEHKPYFVDSISENRSH